MHAARGNAVGATGHAAKAVLEEAHARLCEHGQWVLNEKRMVNMAGLEAAQPLFIAPPRTANDLARWIDALAECLSGKRPATA
jgi:hypothetical protein